MKEVSEKITERIRKLIRLKESATQIGSEGEAHAAAAAVHRLLMEYNLSLLDLAGENPQNRLTACESDRISYKDAAGKTIKTAKDMTIAQIEHLQLMLKSFITVKEKELLDAKVAADSSATQPGPSETFPEAAERVLGDPLRERQLEQRMAGARG